MKDILDFYKSISGPKSLDHSSIIYSCVDEGIVPVSLRYMVVEGSCKGVIKSNKDELYFFVKSNEGVDLMEANTPDKLHQCKSVLEKAEEGCDLIKEEDEDTEKAEGQSGGGESSGLAPTMTEEEYVNSQDEAMTEHHPGGATSYTPDDPDIGRKWHQDQYQKSSYFDELTKSLTDMGKSLYNITPRPNPPPSYEQEKFMKEVLGRTDEEIEEDSSLRPAEKVIFRKWLNKSVEKCTKSLHDWLSNYGE